MTHLSLSEIYSLDMVGLLLKKDGRPLLVEDLVDTVFNVRKVRQSPSQFLCPSATSAAAWLICMSNNVYGQRMEGFQSLDEADIGPEGQSLAFRGQAAPYPFFIPTLCRTPWSIEDQRMNEATLSWLWPAVQYFHDERFRYDPRNRYKDPSFWVGRDEVLIVAQHHGLRTRYLDWTFDPLVALAFSASGLEVGEQGTVSVRGASNSWAVLPPNFLGRLWHQSGFVEEKACFCRPEERSFGTCKKPFEAVGEFHGITFALADEAEKSFLRNYHRHLMENGELPQIERLVQWSKQQAVIKGPAKLYGAGVGSFPSILPIWEANGVELATVPIGDEVVCENLDGVWNMFEKRSLRVRDGVICWDLLSLSSAINSVSMDSTAICMKEADIEMLDPPRRRAMKMAAAGTDHLASTAKYGGEKFVPYFD